MAELKYEIVENLGSLGENARGARNWIWLAGMKRNRNTIFVTGRRITAEWEKVLLWQPMNWQNWRICWQILIWILLSNLIFVKYTMQRGDGKRIAAFGISSCFVKTDKKTEWKYTESRKTEKNLVVFSEMYYNKIVCSFMQIQIFESQTCKNLSAFADQEQKCWKNIRKKGIHWVNRK